ncbi:MAG: PAS domain S-box protein, partial [Acidobacteriota bacterium]
MSPFDSSQKSIQRDDASSREAVLPTRATNGNQDATEVWQLQMFRTLLEHMTDKIYFKDRKARFVCVSRAMAEQHGYTPEEMLGKTDHDLFLPEVAALKFDDDLRVVRGAVIENLVEIEAKKDGQTLWVSTTKVPWKDQRGNIVGLFGISRDVTEQVETETKLRETTLRFSLALKSAQIVSWDWDLDSGCIQLSSG